MTTSSALQAVLEAVYAVYNPQKAGDVPALLKKYKGNEKALLRQVLEKYGLSKAEAVRLYNASLKQDEGAPEPLPFEASNRSFAALKWPLIILGTAGAAILAYVFTAGEPQTQQGSVQTATILAVPSNSGQFSIPTDTADVAEPLTSTIGDCYLVSVEKAYFHSQPAVEAQQQAYLVKNETIRPINELNGFLYIEFSNAQHVVTKGWIQSEDVSLCSSASEHQTQVGQGYWSEDDSTVVYASPQRISQSKAYVVSHRMYPEAIQGDFAYIQDKDDNGHAFSGWVLQSTLQEPED